MGALSKYWWPLVGPMTLPGDVVFVKYAGGANDVSSSKSKKL